MDGRTKDHASGALVTAAPDVTALGAVECATDEGCSVARSSVTRAVAGAVQVCLDFLPESGGMTTSVRQFQQALGGTIVGFQRGGRTDPACPLDVMVPASGAAGRLYAWAPPSARRAAEDAVRRATLIVCHGLYQYHADWAAAMARVHRVPLWLVPHGALDPYVFTYRSARKRAWLATRGRQLLQQAERVIFATEQERAKASTVVGPFPTGCVVPWPVSPGAEPEPGARARLRARYGIGPDERVVLYLGRLHSMKRVLETIAAVGRAKSHGVALIVAGPDGDVTADQCRALAHANRWSNVHIAGPVGGTLKTDHLAGADAFISLSHRENFGHSVAEALAASLPVILAPGVDLSGELRGIDCGWILPRVAPESVDEVLAAFARVPRDGLAARGARGRAWARRVLAPEAFRARLTAMAAESNAGAADDRSRCRTGSATSGVAGDTVPDA